MIEIISTIKRLLGSADFWLREEIKRRIEWRVREVTGEFPSDEIEDGYQCCYVPDSIEIRFVIRQAILEAVTNSTQVKPRWDSYSAKLTLLKPLKPDSSDKKALKKACQAQAQPYRRRALEWLVGLDRTDGVFLTGLKDQVITWLDDHEAGKRTYASPLSEKQWPILLARCFNSNSDRPEDWLPPEREYEEEERFDPWTGERTKVQVPKWEAELSRLKKQYYEAATANAS